MSPWWVLCKKFWKTRPKPHKSSVDSTAAIPENPQVLFYLSGSIEYSPDFGKGWRAQVTPLLKSLGNEVYDPAQDEQKKISEMKSVLDRFHFAGDARVRGEGFFQPGNVDRDRIRLCSNLWATRYTIPPRTSKRT